MPRIGLYEAQFTSSRKQRKMRRLLQPGGSKQVSAFDIKVETKLGEVTLTGSFCVPSRQIKDVAEALAQDTLGVRGV